MIIEIAFNFWQSFLLSSDFDYKRASDSRESLAFKKLLFFWAIAALETKISVVVVALVVWKSKVSNFHK